MPLERRCERIEHAAEHDIENGEDDALRESQTMASEEKSFHASAISSAGSPTMTTGLAPSTATTRTARPTSWGLTRLANHAGT